MMRESLRKYWMLIMVGIMYLWMSIDSLFISIENSELNDNISQIISDTYRQKSITYIIFSIIYFSIFFIIYIVKQKKKEHS